MVKTSRFSLTLLYLVILGKPTFNINVMS